MGFSTCIDIILSEYTGPNGVRLNLLLLVKLLVNLVKLSIHNMLALLTGIHICITSTCSNYTVVLLPVTISSDTHNF